jgi:osmoprotectant transport system permease protein
MGMKRSQVIGRVQVPSGLPLILGGIRVATLQVIATATLGAYVGFNGLGSFINEGFRQQDDGKLLTGALLVAVVTLVVDVVFGRVVRRITPWRAAPMPLATKGPKP